MYEHSEIVQSLSIIILKVIIVKNELKSVLGRIHIILQLICYIKNNSIFDPPNLIN